MLEASLRRLLLVQACEEADPAGRVLPLEARQQAGREALAEAGPGPEAQLAARAERLFARLARERPGLAGLERLARLAPAPALVVGVALAAGLAVDALGRQRQLSLLAFPLLGLLLWNLAVYLALAFGRPRHVAASARLPALVSGLAALRVRLTRLIASADQEFTASVATRFVAAWVAHAGALEAARVRMRLHLGAVCFALGVVAGMYVAGLAFAYQATWESTFLDAAQVRGLLAFVLGPAAALLGSPVPDVASVAALRAPGAGEAAPWIHRWAVTALLAIGLPRAWLAARAAAAARQLANGLAPDLDSAYFTRALSAGRGEGLRVRVLPYSTELSPHSSARLRELAQHLFGNRALVEVMPGVAYGDEPALETGGAVVLVFALAQSPEQEVHGRLVAGLREALAGGPGRLLVVLDEERYAAVVDAERVAERERAWARVLDEAGVKAVSLAPGGDPDALLSAALGALGARDPA